MRKDAAAGGGPPGDVPAVGGTVLVDYERGTSMAIMFFETEEDRQRAHEVLDAMNPPRETGGRRVSVEMFEVGLDLRLPDRSSA